MTEQEQKEEIAKLDENWLDGYMVHWKPYTTSRDAIVPVIERQPPAVLAECCRVLLELLKDYWIQFDKDVDWSSQIMCMMATLKATPAQLCEALLRATGKWKESQGDAPALDYAAT